VGVKKLSLLFGKGKIMAEGVSRRHIQGKINYQGVLIPKTFPPGRKEDLLPAPPYLTFRAALSVAEGTIGVFGHHHDAVFGRADGTLVNLGLIVKIQEAYGKTMEKSDVRYEKSNAIVFVSAKKVMPFLKPFWRMANLFPVVT
jgi:hypothetical protein